MAGNGGYQAPRNPAPVSGPGRLARRTDGGPSQSQATYTGLPYGDAAALAQQQRGAPLAQANPVPTADLSGGQVAVPGFGDPTERPGEPVTTGIDRGPGAGSEVLSQTANSLGYGSLSSLLQSLAGADQSGSIAALVNEALQRGV